jgi:hypothetical protein
MLYVLILTIFTSPIHSETYVLDGNLSATDCHAAATILARYNNHASAHYGCDLETDQ